MDQQVYYQNDITGDPTKFIVADNVLIEYSTQFVENLNYEYGGVGTAKYFKEQDQP